MSTRAVRGLSSKVPAHQDLCEGCLLKKTNHPDPTRRRYCMKREPLYQISSFKLNRFLRIFRSMPCGRSSWKTVLNSQKERGIRMSSSYDISSSSFKRVTNWNYIDYVVPCKKEGCRAPSFETSLYCQLRMYCIIPSLTQQHLAHWARLLYF